MPSCYRKVYEDFHKTKIPKGFHIHHIDGNHFNNDLINLKCVSADEHWKIHFEQGDPIALNGKFIQGAVEAGRKGGSNGKGKPKDNSNGKLSTSLKESYKRRGGSPLKGCTRAEDVIEKIRLATTGAKNPMFGKTHSEESIELIRTNRGSLKGAKNPMFGKTQTDSTKEKISKANKGRESKMKGKIFQTSRDKNFRWYTNGNENKFCQFGTEPEQFRLGRTRCTNT